MFAAALDLTHSHSQTQPRSFLVSELIAVFNVQFQRASRNASCVVRRKQTTLHPHRSLQVTRDYHHLSRWLCATHHTPPPPPAPAAPNYTHRCQCTRGDSGCRGVADSCSGAEPKKPGVSTPLVSMDLAPLTSWRKEGVSGGCEGAAEVLRRRLCNAKVLRVRFGVWVNKGEWDAKGAGPWD